jgi:ABC-type cobalamin transport system ATPase subunit
MTRTTLNIDDPVLREIKDLQKKEGRSLGKIVSRLLAEALAKEPAAPTASRLKWISRPMGAMIDLADKEALYAVLDRDES